MHAPCQSCMQRPANSCMHACTTTTAGLPIKGRAPVCVAWSGAASRSGGAFLELPSELARCLQLDQSAPVLLQPLQPGAVAAAVSVEVEPATESDWEIVEANAGFLEETLLTQVRRGLPVCGPVRHVSLSYVCLLIASLLPPTWRGGGGWLSELFRAPALWSGEDSS
jgi:hypothetical protein